MSATSSRMNAQSDPRDDRSDQSALHPRGPAAQLRRLAIIGGECTGKSTLARELALRWDAPVVPEYLRTFVERERRTPTREEQAVIMAKQIEAEELVGFAPHASGRADDSLSGRTGASSFPDWMICDPAALMTAVYSIVYFGDDSLISVALAHQETYALTVWCLPDFPWVADEGVRDGPEYRQQVHDRIADVVRDYRLSVLPVSGPISTRVRTIEGARKAGSKTAG